MSYRAPLRRAERNTDDWSSAAEGEELATSVIAHLKAAKQASLQGFELRGLEAMNRIRTAIFLGLGLSLVGGAVYASDFVSLSALAKANVNASTGIANDNELVIPRFVHVNDDADLSLPERFKFNYDVFEAGTYEKIGSTQKITTTWPGSPCSSPSWNEYEVASKFVGDPVDNRVHTLINLQVECEESSDGEWKQAIKTVVYSADISTFGGAWTRVFDLEALGMNAVDFDSDGINELVLGLVQELPDGANLKVIMLDTVTGVNDGGGGIDANNKYRVETLIDTYTP